jgi:hypothetical protein
MASAFTRIYALCNKGKKMASFLWGEIDIMVSPLKFKFKIIHKIPIFIHE